MNQPFDEQLRAEVTRYLQGERSLQEFNRWFLPASWDALRGRDPSQRELVGTVGLVLAELSAGHATENDVREELQALLAHPAKTAIPDDRPALRSVDASSPRTSDRTRKLESPSS